MVLNLFITKPCLRSTTGDEIFRINRVECVSSKWKFCQISNKREMNFIIFCSMIKGGSHIGAYALANVKLERRYTLLI